MFWSQNWCLCTITWQDSLINVNRLLWTSRKINRWWDPLWVDRNICAFEFNFSAKTAREVLYAKTRAISVNFYKHVAIFDLLGPQTFQRPYWEKRQGLETSRMASGQDGKIFVDMLHAGTKRKLNDDGLSGKLVNGGLSKSHSATKLRRWSLILIFFLLLLFSLSPVSFSIHLTGLPCLFCHRRGNTFWRNSWGRERAATLYRPR